MNEQLTRTTQPTSFVGGFDSFLQGFNNVVDTGINSAIKWEQYKQAKDQTAQGQHELMNAVDMPTNMPDPNLVAPNQPAATSSLNLSNQKLLIGGGVVLLATLLIVKLS